MKMKLSLKSKFKINVESECSISAKNWIQIILAWCFIFIALQSLKLLWLVLTNLDQNETFLGFVNHLLLQWWCEQIKWTTTSRIDLTNWAYKIIKMKFFGQSPFGGAVVVQVHFFFSILSLQWGVKCVASGTSLQVVFQNICLKDEKSQVKQTQIWGLLCLYIYILRASKLVLYAGIWTS